MTAPSPTAHLIVDAGPDRGLEIVVPPGGLRVGRSSNNDVVLKDPVMSRFHCRFYIKPGDGLWAEDLGSANQTLVNDQPIRETRLRPGDHIALGDTRLRVLRGEADPAPPGTAALFDSPAAGAARPPIEFRRAPGNQEAPRKALRAALLTLLILMAAGVAWIFLGQVQRGAAPVAPGRPTPASAAPSLAIVYEKVSADTNNIFRYFLTLEDGALSIQITDLANKRQVAGAQHKPVAPEVLIGLAESLAHSDFFGLQDTYQGLGERVWETCDLGITLGRRTHRVRVINTLEPDAFKAVRETVEEFGQNELGLAALALAPDRLIELARAANLRGRSLYDQREVKHDNLARAIRALREAEWYLETIEPKPAFYADLVPLRADAERELQAVHDNLVFMAERAIRLRDWDEAARHLRVLCERIPDRSDTRHQAARKKLLDVERHLKRP